MLFTFIFKIILTKSTKYFLALINIFEENRISVNKYKSIRKSWNKTIEISAKSKIWNLLKSRTRNLFKSKKV